MARTQCTELDMHLAKTRTLAILKNQYHLLNNSMFNILTLYLYLKLNIAIITNYYEYFKSNKTIYIDADPNDTKFKQIEEEIPKLYKTLQESILQL